MQVKTMICVACFLTTISFAGICVAQNDQTENATLAKIHQQMLELKRQMDEMKKKHESEVNALKTEIEKLKQPAPVVAEAEDELAKLRELAESVAGEEAVEKKTPEETVFKFGGLSLQQLNPEISASGDFLSHYRHQSGTRQRTDAEIRGLELNFQSYLDPFSRMKATTHISDDGVDVEEVYFTRFSVFDSANLDVGRFRQQFGVVNRWHEDALDQIQYPLALRRIFGDGGLNQTGASVEWTLPEWADAYQGLTLQVTNSENDQLFGGETLGLPCLLFHYKNYRDLSRDTYFEFGLSGLFGWNDEWDVREKPGDAVTHQTDALGTRVFGADVSFLWEPVDRALYRNLEWRSEIYCLNRDILAPDNSGRDSLNAWGAYSYIQGKVARNLILGVRADYYEPDGKDYAFGTLADEDHSIHVPFAYAAKDPYRWQVGPYITWWQSDWVRFRGEYDYAWGEGMESDEHVLWFQATFAAGPHKHERY